jgi:hypothetical protein
LRRELKELKEEDLKEIVVDLEERLMDLIEVNLNYDYPPFELEIYSVLGEIERFERMISSKPVINKE